ncbi:MAG: hypothetical protein HOV94_23370 [Saccharothrix sp.]|nr:hypothetical protein [Saccharothrix sp.]
MSAWQRVADTVRAMRRRGVVFGDLHMDNVVCSDEDDRVWPIDSEGGWFVAEGGRRVMANAGFAAPRDRTGVDVDEYCLAALKIAVFAPLTSMFRLNRGKAAHLAEVVADRFGVPAQWLADAVATLTGGLVRSAAPSTWCHRAWSAAWTSDNCAWTTCGPPWASSRRRPTCSATPSANPLLARPDASTDELEAACRDAWIWPLVEQAAGAFAGAAQDDDVAAA